MKLTTEETNNLIKTELADLEYGLLRRDGSGHVKAINDRRAFAKTKVFQLLRTKKLQDESLHYLFTNYLFTNREIVDFIFKFVGSVNLQKAKEIGLLEVMLMTQSRLYCEAASYPQLLFRHIEPEFTKSDLSALLNTFHDEKNVLRALINKFFFSSECESEREKSINLIKNNYKHIFEIYVEDFDTETNPSFEDNLRYYQDPFHVEEAKVEHHIEERTTQLITAFKQMPFWDIDFIYEKVNEKEDLEIINEIVLVLSGLMAKEVSEEFGEDFDRRLKQVETLHSSWNIKTPLHDIFKVTLELNPSNFKRFVQRVRDAHISSNSRKREIYDTYIAEIDLFNIVESFPWEIQLNTILGASEEKIIGSLNDRFAQGLNLHMLGEFFDCNPRCKYTYPTETFLEAIIDAIFKEVLLREYYSHEKNVEIRKSFARKSFNEKYKFYMTLKKYWMPNDRLITWRMANDPAFLDYLINMDLPDFKISRISTYINYNSIGVDSLRKAYERARRESGKSDFDFSFFDRSSAFEPHEVSQFKSLFIPSKLITLSNIDYKTIQFLLHRPGHSQEKRATLNALAYSLKDKTELSKNELVKLILLLSDKKCFSTIFISKRHDDTNFSISMGEEVDKQVTVADITNLYDKMEAS